MSFPTSQTAKRDGGGTRQLTPGGFTWDNVHDEKLAEQFITAAETLADCIAATSFRSERQLNAVIEYARKLIKFKMVQEIQVLMLWLAGRPAICGYSRAQAIMLSTGSPIPEAIGVPLSKKGLEILKEYARRGAQQPPSQTGGAQQKEEIGQ